MIRLAVDYEHTSRLWWESGGEDLWRGITEDFDTGSVVVDDDLARSWLSAAGAIEGWGDGPDYAPHPVRMEVLADDEPH